jgi:hypothetical protein
MSISAYFSVSVSVSFAVALMASQKVSQNGVVIVHNDVTSYATVLLWLGLLVVSVAGLERVMIEKNGVSSVCCKRVTHWRGDMIYSTAIFDYFDCMSYGYMFRICTESVTYGIVKAVLMTRQVTGQFGHAYRDATFKRVAYEHGS